MEVVAGVTTEDPVVWELVLLMQQLDRGRRLLETRTQLGSADQRLMWLLSDRRPRTLREISEQLGLEQSTINRQVNAALKSGLIRRTREAGRLANLIAATDEGLARFAHDRTLNLTAYARALAAVGGPEDRASFVGLLDEFVVAFSVSVADRSNGKGERDASGGDRGGERKRTVVEASKKLDD